MKSIETLGNQDSLNDSDYDENSVSLPENQKFLNHHFIQNFDQDIQFSNVDEEPERNSGGQNGKFGA